MMHGQKNLKLHIFMCIIYMQKMFTARRTSAFFCT